MGDVWASTWDWVASRVEVIALSLNVVAIIFLADQLRGEKAARRLDSTLVLFQLLDGHWRRYREETRAETGTQDTREFEHGQVLAAMELVAMTINRGMIEGHVSGFYRDYLRGILEFMTSTEMDRCQIVGLITKDDTFAEIRTFLESEPEALEYRSAALATFSGFT